MKCVEVEQQIDSFLDGEISFFYTKQIESHLENCSSCSQYLEKLQSMSNLLKSSLPVAASTQLDARVMEAFRQHQNNQPLKAKPFGVWTSIFGQLVIPKPVLALCLLGLTVLTGLVFQLGRMTAPNNQSQLTITENVTKSENNPSKNAENIPTKIVEVPVTKFVKVTVVKEKIVSRIIYKNGRLNNQLINKAQTANSDNSMINNSAKNNAFLTQISLKDYLPVSEIKLKVFKKGENINE